MKTIKRKMSGFTLIEIMVVVAILAFLAAIAYPSYIDSIRKGKRSDAKVALLQAAQLQEEYFMRNFSYASTMAQLGYPDDPADSPEREYDISISARIPAACNGTQGANSCSGYTVRAVPNVDVNQPMGQTNDILCRTFTMTNSGRKAATDNNGANTTDACW